VEAKQQDISIGDTALSTGIETVGTACHHVDPIFSSMLRKTVRNKKSKLDKRILWYSLKSDRILFKATIRATFVTMHWFEYQPVILQ
jgi:hypothetical protein